MTGIVLDVSNHDLSTFDAECLRASGVERIIIGCWDYTATETILKRARAAGIVVEDLYAYLYYGLGYEQREVTNALSLARQYGGIRRIWADCEAVRPYEAPGMTPHGRIQATWRAVEAIASAGIQPGIYTYRYYWLNQMANTTEFSKLPLWFANYGMNDPNNPIQPIREVDFGGWRTLAAHQYSSTIVRCGRVRDHNYWYLDEEDDMALREEIDRLKVALFAGSERRGMSFEEKLRLANWYIDETIGEKRQSMADVAASAIAVAGQLAREVAQGGDADIDALEQMADLFERNAAELRALRAEKQ